MVYDMLQIILSQALDQPQFTHTLVCVLVIVVSNVPLCSFFRLQWLSTSGNTESHIQYAVVYSEAIQLTIH